MISGIVFSCLGCCPFNQRFIKTDLCNLLISVFLWSEITSDNSFDWNLFLVSRSELFVCVHGIEDEDILDIIYQKSFMINTFLIWSHFSVIVSVACKKNNEIVMNILILHPKPFTTNFYCKIIRSGINLIIFDIMVEKCLLVYWIDV